MLSFIIFNKNQTQDTLECIDSIYTFVDQKKEIVVVDNISLPKPAMEIRNIFPEVRVVENSTESYAKAANLGIKSTIGEFVFLLLPLLRFTEKSNVEQLVDYFSDDEKIGLLTPKIVMDDGTLYHSCRRFPKESLLLLKRLPPLLQFGRLKEMEKYEMRDFDHTSIMQIDWCVRSCMVFTRKSVEAAGFFDERYGFYLEDLDFCRSMKEAGLDVLFYPHTVLVHKQKPPEKKDFAHIKGFTQALNYYFEKWPQARS